MEIKRTYATQQVARYGPFSVQAILAAHTDEWSLKPIFDLCLIVEGQEYYVTQIHINRSTLPEILESVYQLLTSLQQAVERMTTWARTLSDTQEVQRLLQENHRTLMFFLQQQSLEEYRENITQAIANKTREVDELHTAIEQLLRTYPILAQPMLDRDLPHIFVPPSYADLFMMAVMDRMHLLRFPAQVQLGNIVKTWGAFTLHVCLWREATGIMRETPYYAMTLDLENQDSIDLGFIGQAESDEAGWLQRMGVCQQILGHALSIARARGEGFIGVQANRLNAIIAIKQAHYTLIQDAWAKR